MNTTATSTKLLGCASTLLFADLVTIAAIIFKSTIVLVGVIPIFALVGLAAWYATKGR